MSLNYLLTRMSPSRRSARGLDLAKANVSYMTGHGQDVRLGHDVLAAASHCDYQCGIVMLVGVSLSNRAPM